MHRNPECLRDVRRILGYPPLLDMVWERMSIHVPLQQLADNIHAAEEDNDYQRPCACTRCREQHRSKRSEEHTSELQPLMRISYAVLCLKKKTPTNHSNIFYRLLSHKQHHTT